VKGDALTIGDDLAIPLTELRFRFTRSGGPGGQKVNRTATRVELLFDVRNSPSLSDEQRLLIGSRLRGYIDGEGVLHLVSQATSSQRRNREDVTQRLRNLLAYGSRPKRERRATRPSVSAREGRLRYKRKRSLTKRRRRPVSPEEW
jgi:ribosome-associated protein